MKSKQGGQQALVLQKLVAVWSHPPGAALMPGPVVLARGQSESPGRERRPGACAFESAQTMGLHRAGSMRPALQDQTWIRAIEGSRTEAHSPTLCLGVPCGCWNLKPAAATDRSICAATDNG